MEVAFHITLQKPPVGVSFGLQKGSGNNYQTLQIQQSTQHDLYFNFTATVKGDEQKGDEPDFAGPFVQGPRAGRFIYIDIGTYAGRAELFGRRLKIPLTGITWDMLNQVMANTQLGLGTSVPGTGKDGTPNCATVKPFAGWTVKQRA